MLCVCKDKKRKYQSLGISVSATHWDFKKNQLKEDCPDYVRIQLIIDTEIGKIKRKALDNRLEGKEFTVTTLLETSEKPPMQTVGELYLSYIESLKRENRVRYAGMYQISYNSFIKFNKHLDIPFIDIDTGWLKRYEQWMRSQNFAVNTIGTRLRHLRVIFNQALDMKLITTDNYPFRAYKVSKMNQQTAKRALSKKDIINIINYKGKSELEILAIDIFAFSYFTAGINFIDIALLKDGNIIDNKTNYIYISYIFSMKFSYNNSMDCTNIIKIIVAYKHLFECFKFISLLNIQRLNIFHICSQFNNPMIIIL